MFDDGRVIRAWKDLDRTCQGIAEFSPRDAEAYRKFVHASQQALSMFMAALYQPPLWPFMHPGGGVFGAGRAIAIEMMDDMDIDYAKVMAEPVR